MNMPTRDPEPTWNPTYNQSPPQFDKELTTRSSLVCGGGKLSEDQYNVGLHVMALLVMLGQSTLAAAFPLIAKKFPLFRIPPNFLFFVRHFGTGVLIATAFVHLLPTAFNSLNNPCLPPFWNTTYPAIPGAIAMVAVFLVILIEMIFAKGHLCAGMPQEANEDVNLEAAYEERKAKRKSNEQARKHRPIDGNEKENDEKNYNGIENNEEHGSTSDSNTDRGSSEEIGASGGLGKIGFGMAGKRRSRSHSFGKGLRRVEAELERVRSNNHSNDNIGIGEVNTTREARASLRPVIYQKSQQYEQQETEQERAVKARDEKILDQLVPRGQRSEEWNPTIILTPEQKKKKALLQVMLLEMGILFHSVFIGMALSVSVGPEFVVLLIAIIFHQTFEGLALGSRISEISWKSHAVQPWLMALAYGVTTPIGQAIGLATHSLYSPHSQTGLLMVGIMNAISSGCLLYAALVELLAEDFLSDESWVELSGIRRVIACIIVVLGAAGMSIVGAYA